MVTIAGADDPIAPAATVAAWSQHAGAGHTHHILSGGHFLLKQHADTLRRIACAAAA
jgi:surfactin synthase thioesterase subunit